jgi:hypothetical protein
MCWDEGKKHAKRIATASHALMSIDDLKANPELATAVVCASHQKVFEYFDTICFKLICISCFALEHNGHKCMSLTDAANLCRTKLGTAKANCDQLALQIESAQLQVDSVIRELASNLQAATTEVNGSFKPAIDSLVLRQRNLLHQINETHQRKYDALAQQQGRLGTLRSAIAGASTRAADVMKWQGDGQLIEAHADICSSLAAFRLPRLQPDEEPTFGDLSISLPDAEVKRLMHAETEVTVLQLQIKDTQIYAENIKFVCGIYAEAEIKYKDEVTRLQLQIENAAQVESTRAKKDQDEITELQFRRRSFELA